MIPFFWAGTCRLFANGKMIGLSKIPRIVDMFSRRLQIQERLKSQIASTLEEYYSQLAWRVLMEGRHLCMQMRGVEKQNSYASTSAMWAN
ncbi:MAG: hypothetical protein Ct9H300mP29_6010 [Candidatus Neomarinimicrobiota bacterium]|nr:MAG: hypothetical protein Ct9H300mP29_6010 [Candidatus Neomarinimicrobiota bacterium]